MTENEVFYFLNLSMKLSKYFVQLSCILKILNINSCFCFLLYCLYNDAIKRFLSECFPELLNIGAGFVSLFSLHFVSDQLSMHYVTGCCEGRRDFMLVVG